MNQSQPAADRIPPQSLVAERSVLGAILITGALPTAVREVGLEPPHFYLPKHQAIFAAIGALDARNEPADAVTVAGELGKSRLDQVGGEAYIHSLPSEVPAAAHAGKYARTVRDLAEMRLALGIARSIEKDVFAPGATATDVLRRAEASIRGATSAQLDHADRYALLTVADLDALPEPAYLIDGLLAARALNVIYGPSGCGKSFLALDFSACVAAGLPWYGRMATPGPVVYIAAEGAGGVARRMRAWGQARRQPTVDGLRFLPDAVNLLDQGDLDRARRTIQTLDEPPALIVIDTMARSMVGGDENAARDVGLFIDNLDRLRAESDAAALVVHHTGKNGEDERGSSALRGAADLMMALKPDGASLRLECTKAKESEPFDPWTLHLSEVADSCVLRLGSDSATLSAAERSILETLPGSFGSEPVAAGKLLRASGVPERSFYRALQSLTDRGYVYPAASGRSKLYSLTAVGQEALLPTTASDCQTTDGITAATPASLGAGSGSHPDRETNGWHEASAEEQAEIERLIAKHGGSA